MQDPLAEYRQKRDFAATPEPAGDGALRRGDDVFVVHRHEARQLHYDLRLEQGGVLTSWAVPRGFSYAPAEKRLAVRTEDHPLAYEHFSGRIPKGQYGAGTMTIWDRGTYRLVKEPDWERALAKGELKALLFGRRLRGEWHLVRTQQGPNTWLLFKSKDRYAGPDRDSVLGVDLAAAAAAVADVPLTLSPMRPDADRPAFVDSDWLFEMEFTGLRSLVDVRLDGARAAALATIPGPVRRELAALRCERALLDGVFVATDAAGRPSAQALATALRTGDEERIAFYAFDLLQWEEFDLRTLPLLDRKAALRASLPAGAHVLFVDHVRGDGPALAAAIVAAGLPGAIGKRAIGGYGSGASSDWLRIDVAATTTTGNAAGDATRPATVVARRWKPSNLSKVYWPAEGYTKGDLIAYYAAVAEVLLPHLRDRPLHLNRFPDGIDGKSFYQREVKDGSPEWLRTVPIPHDGAVVPHHVVDDLDALLHVVNLGSIDLHPWLSRVPSLDEPDWAVLDLDPKSAPFAHVVRIARAAGRLLRGIGLRPLLKTSGKSGMHVFVPLRPGYSYDHARMFLEAIARVLVRELPDIATVERLPENRGGKVYLDFLQNRRSQTIVPPYSVRPVRGASVSMPLSWDELEDDELSPQRFTIHTAPPRIAARGDLFRAALEDRQDLMPAIAALQDVLRGG